jgi:hypothetical protein
VVEPVYVAAREGVTVTEAVTRSTVPVAEGLTVATLLVDAVPDTLAAAEREPDAQALSLREARALPETVLPAEGDRLIEPLPVADGEGGVDKEKVISAEAVLLLVEDSEVLGVRVLAGVTVGQNSEALTLAEAMLFVPVGVPESTPEFEELITDRMDNEDVDVSELDAPAECVALKSGVVEVVGVAVEHVEGEEVGVRELAGEEESLREARGLHESETEPQSDAEGELREDELGDTVWEREGSALIDTIEVLDAAALAEWLAQGANVKVVLEDGEKLCVGVLDRGGEREVEGQLEAVGLSETLLDMEGEPLLLLVLVVCVPEREAPTVRVTDTDRDGARVEDGEADSLAERETLKVTPGEADTETLIVPTTNRGPQTVAEGVSVPLSGGRDPEEHAEMDAEPLSDSERGGERDAEVDCDTFPEAEGEVEKRGEPVERAVREAEWDTDREPQGDELAEVERVKLRDTVVRAVREVDTVTVLEKVVRLTEAVPEAETDTVLVAFALLGEIVLVAFADQVPAIPNWSREAEGLPLLDMSPEVARGVADWQSDPLVEPVWEELPEFEREMEGLGEAEGERVEFADAEALRDALTVTLTVRAPVVTTGDREVEAHEEWENEDKPEAEGTTIVREGVRVAPNASEALWEAEPLTVPESSLDVDVDADAAAEDDWEGDAEADLVSWADCVHVALSGTRVVVVETPGEREMEGVMDAEPVIVPVAEGRAVTVTVEVAETEGPPLAVPDTLLVAAALPLRDDEVDAVPHADSVERAEVVNDAVARPLVVWPELEADRVTLEDPVSHDAVGETEVEGVPVATGFCDADFVEDADEDSADDPEGDPEMVPLAVPRMEAVGAKLVDTERLAAPEGEMEGEPDSVPLEDDEADAAAVRVGAVDEEPEDVSEGEGDSEFELGGVRDTDGEIVCVRETTAVRDCEPETEGEREPKGDGDGELEVEGERVPAVDGDGELEVEGERVPAVEAVRVARTEAVFEVVEVLVFDTVELLEGVSLLEKEREGEEEADGVRAAVAVALGQDDALAEGLPEEEADTEVDAVPESVVEEDDVRELRAVAEEEPVLVLLVEAVAVGGMYVALGEVVRVPVGVRLVVSVPEGVRVGEAPEDSDAVGEGVLEGVPEVLRDLVGLLERVLLLEEVPLGVGEVCKRRRPNPPSTRSPPRSVSASHASAAAASGGAPDAVGEREPVGVAVAVGDAEEVKEARRKNTPPAAATRRVKPSHASAAARGTGSEPGEGLLGRRPAADVDAARTSKVKGKVTASTVSVGESNAMSMKNSGKGIAEDAGFHTNARS